MAHEQELTGVSHSDLPKLQLVFTTYGKSQKVQWGGKWSSKDSALANADLAANGKQANSAVPFNLLAVKLRIVQAPMSYSMPVPQKKTFRPPFKVRLHLWYTGRLQVPVKVEAFALPEQSIDLFVKHRGEGVLVPTNLSQQNELQNASISSCIQTHDNEDSDSTEKHSFEDIEFTELRFSKSSRMNRRWTLFTCKLGRDMLYAIYLQPTIVLSRKTDQYDKACMLLSQTTFFMPDHWSSKVPPLTHLSTGRTSRQQGFQQSQAIQGNIANKGVAPCHNHHRRSCLGRQCIKRDTVEQFILTKYGDSGLSRTLTNSELEALCLRAGLHPAGGSGNSCDGIDCNSWFQFHTWFSASLKSLKPVNHLWSSSDMTRICPFNVDRMQAESWLEGMPDGTFVVRACSEPSAFAISTKVHPAGSTPEVKHVLIDGMDLREKSLEMWIDATHWAQYLLDIQSGNCISKSVAFGSEAQGLDASLPELGSYIVEPAVVWSPSPQLSNTTNVDPGTPTLDLEREVSDEIVGDGFATSQSPIAPHHLVEPQSQLQIHPHHPSYGQDGFTPKRQRTFFEAGGQTQQKLSYWDVAERGESVFKKRLSSRSVNTEVDFEERPNKRRVIGFIDDSGLLVSVPTHAIQSLDTFNGIKHVNI